MNTKLADKVAVVTGASKGIGAAIAKHLAAEGAAVVVNYSSSKDGAERVVVHPASMIGSDAIPLPAHPYRDSALFYGVLSGCLVGVTYATAGGIVRAFVVAAGFFVIATGFSWWRFRAKLAERESER